MKQRIRDSNFKRFNPAAAKTIASYSPASSFPSRVPTFPRKSLMMRSGRRSFIWHYIDVANCTYLLLNLVGESQRYHRYLKQKHLEDLLFHKW